MADQLASRVLTVPTINRDWMVAWLPALYPLSLIVGLFSLPGGNVALRLGLLVAALPALLVRPPIGPTYRRWFAVLGLYLGTTTLSALAASNPALAWADLQRQVFLVAVVIGISLALADLRARKAFSVASVGVAITASVLILSLYGRFAGLSLIGPVQETFKSYASNSFEVPLNADSFAALLSVFLVLPFVLRRPSAVILLLVPVLIAVGVSGSRTTVVSLIAMIPITAILLLIRRSERIPSWVPALSIAVVAGWAAIRIRPRDRRLRDISRTERIDDRPERPLAGCLVQVPRTTMVWLGRRIVSDGAWPVSSGD